MQRKDGNETDENETPHEAEKGQGEEATEEKEHGEATRRCENHTTCGRTIEGTANKQ